MITSHTCNNTYKQMTIYNNYLNLIFPSEKKYDLDIHKVIIKIPIHRLSLVKWIDLNNLMLLWSCEHQKPTMRSRGFTVKCQLTLH